MQTSDQKTTSHLVGKAGFEPATSASRTLRANQAAPLPASLTLADGALALEPFGARHHAGLVVVVGLDSPSTT